jgi:hypothetical protein
MTAWEIALDLVRRFALAEDYSKPADPLAWYAENHREDVDYSQILKALAPRLGDRQALLNPYFEPSDDERQQDLKAPTRAHRVLAKLVAAGAIRLIITTNFDRLIERALEDAGVAPFVVASADDAQSAPSLHSVRCLVVKVNGDSLSPNFRNTLTELATYEEPLTELLSRILKDYGLIVCGWSAEWDPALRTLLVEQQSAFYSTFWAHRGEPADAAQDVIKARQAIRVAIEDADAFFSDLTGKVTALSDLQRGAPSSSEIGVAELKRYMTDPVHRVRLHDLVMNEVERVIEDPIPEMLPLDWQLNPRLYMDRIAAIEASMSTLLPLLANLAYYADEDRHDDLVVRAIERLAKLPIQGGGAEPLLKLRQYPALLALYIVGLAALASRRPRPFGRALAEISVEEDLSNPPIAIACELASSDVLDDDTLRKTDEFENKKTPASDLLHDRLRKHLKPLVMDPLTYDNLFDDVEYVQGLGMMDATERWAQIGRFSWRRVRYPGRGTRDGVVDRHGADLVASGMFSGSEQRLTKVHIMYEGFLDKQPSRRRPRGGPSPVEQAADPTVSAQPGPGKPSGTRRGRR